MLLILNSQFFSQELQEELLEQCGILSENAKKQKSLTMPRQIPQPLKQFEPKVEERFVQEPHSQLLMKLDL